jgi:magnesium transporter
VTQQPDTTTDAAAPDAAPRAHHRHLEQARDQIIELLSRQSVERELLAQDDGPKKEVAAQLLARQQHAQLSQRLAGFHPADVAFVLESLAPEARELAWQLVAPAQRGAVLLEMSESVLRTLLRDMEVEEIASAVRHLESDDIADLLEPLPEAVSQEVIARLDRRDQEEVRTVLSFPDGTVGAMMDLDFITVREGTTVEAVQRLLRRNRADVPSDCHQVIVIDRGRYLKGTVDFQQLLFSEPEDSVVSVMNVEPHYFYTDDEAESALDAFEKYDLIEAPVLNLHRQVVGRLTVDAVVDEINEKAQADSLRQRGLTEDEDLFAPVLASARNRAPWLALNLLTAFLASRVIDAFEVIIVQLVALAALMPIVASIGGNTGNQTMALVIRGLALDQVRPSQLRQMFSKEFSVATVNGLLWGSVLGVATLIFYGNPALAGVITLAVLFNLWVASTAGVLVPLMLYRAGRDPVMGSSIILTFLTDSGGFFIFLGLAALLLV